jgi:integrase
MTGLENLKKVASVPENFCQWCVRTSRLPDNPLSHVSKLREQVDVRHERRALADAELAKLIDSAEKSTEIVRELAGPDRAMLYRFAVGTGLRASEIASLKTDSLLLGQEPPVVIVEAAYSKRRQRDEQPIPTWLAERLRVWLAKRPGQPMLWVDPQVLWPGSWRRHAAEMLRADLEAAEIDYRDAAGRVFDFHALRHQYVSDLADAGVHPRVAQSLARHSSIELTMKRYTHVAMHNVVGALESLQEPIAPVGTTLRATGNRSTIGIG